MIRYILKRILFALPVLVGITVLDYALMSLAGSPLDMMRGPRMSQEAVAVKAASFGLDKPVYEQFLLWFQQLLLGNLGFSFKSYQPVTEIIGSHVGSTLLLMGTSLVLSLLIAIPLGIYSALHRYTKRDHTLVALSFVGTSIPGFFLSLILIFVFTVCLGWLPSGGMQTVGSAVNLGDLLRHLAMPVTVLAVGIAGSNLRYVRSAVLEVLQQDYLRTARAKGLGRFLTINKHALRNALIPIVTVVGMEIPSLFGGAVIVEQIFGWPGLGLIAMNAITNRDYPVIMGVCLLTAVVVMAANLITDVVYALVDPKVRYR